MGCANSKQKRCKNCNPAVPRSYSMHVVHPPQQKGDTYHFVALTSTTLGSLDDSNSKETNLNASFDDLFDSQMTKNKSFIEVPNDDNELKKNEFAVGLVEAKTWSSMIQDKITKVAPKTPTMTPPGEPETINTWELMAGLEENTSPVHRFRSFSFDVSKGNDGECGEDDVKRSKCNGGIIKDCELGKEKVIVYFTSLRGVRKTYEDCCHVRVILKGLGVRVDERDVSMHSKFKEELREVMGERLGALPRVFVGKKYIGGAEEIRKMNEQGELEKMVDGCEMLDESCGGNTGCEACGDVRFVPCETCSGSCKIYYEEEEEEDDDGDDEEDDVNVSGEFGFQRCPDCNENGLIRCPICCD